MSTETFSLADSDWLSSQRSNFDVYKAYKTRLLRVDLAPRASRNPFRQVVHRYLRVAWFYFRSKRNRSQKQDQQQQGALHKHADQGSAQEYQNTVRLTDILARFLVALLSGMITHPGSLMFRALVLRALVLHVFCRLKQLSDDSSIYSASLQLHLSIL